MITGEAILSYPAIFEPKANLSGAMKYSCSLLFDKSDTAAIADLNKAIERAINTGKEQKWKGKVPSFRYAPLRDGDAELASGEKTDPVYAGKLFVNCNSDNPPGVVDKTGKPLMDRSKLYPGCIVRADVNPFPYDNAGNKGIGWGLNNIMVVRDGNRLDGKLNAEQAFSKFVESDNLE